MKRLTSVRTAEQSRKLGRPMRNRHSRPTKTLPVVEALKALPVDRAVLPVGPRDPLVDRAAHLVDPRGHLGAQAVLLAGPGDHPAKKSSEPDPPPAANNLRCRLME